MLRLTDEELKQTVTRASEIASQSTGHSDTVTAVTSESQQPSLAAYLDAAAELGIPKDAMLQALRERMLAPAESVQPGDMVFAPSVDGASYPAKVLRADETTVEVEFLTGGSQRITRMDVRPLGLVPGREVEFDSEKYLTGVSGLWYRGTIQEYNPQTTQAKIKYAYSSYNIPLKSLRLAAPKVQKEALPASVRDLLIRASLISGSVGLLLGYLVGHLLR